MPEMIYSFNGKDITMNVCIQIRDVLKLLQRNGKQSSYCINYQLMCGRIISRLSHK